jgi:hypothetical protein
MSTCLLGFGSSWLKDLLSACLVLHVAKGATERVCTPREIPAVLGKIVLELLVFKKDVPAGPPRSLETTIGVITAPAVAGGATTTAPSPQIETAKEATATHCLLVHLE